MTISLRWHFLIYNESAIPRNGTKLTHNLEKTSVYMFVGYCLAILLTCNTHFNALGLIYFRITRLESGVLKVCLWSLHVKFRYRYEFTVQLQQVFRWFVGWFDVGFITSSCLIFFMKSLARANKCDKQNWRSTHFEDCLKWMVAVRLIRLRSLFANSTRASVHESEWHDEKRKTIESRSHRHPLQKKLCTLESQSLLYPD